MMFSGKCTSTYVENWKWTSWLVCDRDKLFFCLLYCVEHLEKRMEQRKTSNAACKQTLRRKSAETKGKEMSLMKTSQIQKKLELP